MVLSSANRLFPSKFCFCCTIDDKLKKSIWEKLFQEVFMIYVDIIFSWRNLNKLRKLCARPTLTRPTSWFAVSYEQFFFCWDREERTKVYLTQCPIYRHNEFYYFAKFFIINVLQGHEYASEKLEILEHGDVNIFKS